MTRTLKMTTRIPTRSRISPTLWMLNPEECTEVASLRMAPTTTSTIPNDVKPIPEFLFMGPECRPNPLNSGEDGDAAGEAVDERGCVPRSSALGDRRVARVLRERRGLHCHPGVQGK